MKSRIPFSALLWLAILAMPLAAHHSVSAEFDVGKPVTLSGVVSNVDAIHCDRVLVAARAGHCSAVISKTTVGWRVIRSRSGWSVSSSEASRVSVGNRESVVPPMTSPTWASVVWSSTLASVETVTVSVT